MNSKLNLKMVELKSMFKLGKIFQKFILLEIFKFSFTHNTCLFTLFHLNQGARKYIKDNKKYIQLNLKNKRIKPYKIRMKINNLDSILS